MLAMVVLDNSYVFGIDLIVSQSHHHPGGRAELRSADGDQGPRQATPRPPCAENRAGYLSLSLSLSLSHLNTVVLGHRQQLKYLSKQSHSLILSYLAYLLITYDNTLFYTLTT